VVSSTTRSHFTPGKDPVPIVKEAGWAPGPVWTGGKPRSHWDSIPGPSSPWSVALPTELPGPQPICKLQNLIRGGWRDKKERPFTTNFYQRTKNAVAASGVCSVTRKPHGKRTNKLFLCSLTGTTFQLQKSRSASYDRKGPNIVVNCIAF
jgi:hypothetical protein